MEGIEFLKSVRTLEIFGEGVIKVYRIYATIYCEQKSQKGILIGKGGSLLKKIGTEARIELEKITEKKVFLSLEVKVEKDWRKKDRILKNFGYVSDNG